MEVQPSTAIVALQLQERNFPLKRIQTMTLSLPNHQEPYAKGMRHKT